MSRSHSLLISLVRKYIISTQILKRIKCKKTITIARPAKSEFLAFKNTIKSQTRKMSKNSTVASLKYLDSFSFFIQKLLFLIRNILISVIV